MEERKTVGTTNLTRLETATAISPDTARSKQVLRMRSLRIFRRPR